MAGKGTPRRGRRRIILLLLVLAGLGILGMAGGRAWPALAFELGYAYENGSFRGWTPGFAQDHGRAAWWLGQAAEAEHPRAQYMLGILYARGWGLPQDDALAVEWFTRAAGQGYGPARYHLGWMYHKGEGVPQDQWRALALLEQAAGQGMAAAHLALGRFHERGEGVAVDLDQARRHYELAMHFAQTRPELFDNGAFAPRARAARDGLAARLGPP